MKKSFTLLFILISTLTFAQDLEKGKVVFTTNCAGCHNMEKNVVGPALENVVEAQGRDWVQKWISNSTELIATGDAHANDIFNQYNKMPMPAFGYLPKEDMTALLDYMEGFKKDKEAKAAAAAPPPSAEGGKDGEAKSGGLSKLQFIIILVILAIIVVAAFVIIIALRLLDSHYRKVSITNSHLMKKLNVDSKEVKDEIDTLFEKEIAERMDEKLKKLKKDINNNLENFNKQ